MFFGPLSEVRSFLEDVTSTSLPGRSLNLSQNQINWLGVCITSMILMSLFCFAKIQKASAGKFTGPAFSWMLHHSKIPWNELFQKSILRLIRLFGSKGFLVIDDTDRLRAKSTSKLFGVHKLKDKKTGGYATGQNIVLLLFVTSKMTFPVGFQFYVPDPAWVAWKTEDRKQRALKIPARLRPKKPERSPQFPTKIALAGALIEKFSNLNSSSHIIAINADSAYSCSDFIDKCNSSFPGVQVISQIRSNQLVRLGNQKLRSVREMFSSRSAITTKITLRGKIERNISYSSMRLWVRSQNRVLHIIALKYQNETEYRYITATDLTWKGLDVVRAYSTRWLVEVFFQDWKLYDGWGKSACQRGAEGARRGVILSLLVDHFLLSHPFQLDRVKTGVAAFTSGSLQRYLQSKSIFDSVALILESSDPKKALQDLFNSLEKWVEFRSSDKHMTGRDLGEFIPSPSLVQKFKPRVE